MKEKSKRLVKFLNRITQFNADLELVDVFASAVNHKELKDETKLFKYVIKNKHKVLAKRKAIEHNRKMAVNHLRQTVYSSYIKDLYEEMTTYLRELIIEAFNNLKVTPERVVGEHKVQMGTAEILNLFNDGTLVDAILDKVFQALENERSTINLIDKVCKKLGITIDEVVINEAVYFLEIRHKLIHTDGYADNDFRMSHPTLSYTNDNFIVLNYATVSNARDKITKLIEEIDKDAITKGIILPHINH